MRRLPKPSLFARAIAVIAAGGVALGLGACLSPTLPLPPPELPQNLQDLGDGTWSVSGTCIPGAQVIVFDEDTNLGAVVVDADQNGGYFVVIKASVCDFITVEQAIGTEQSAEVGFILEPLTNGKPDGASVCGQ